eukprot:gene97-130_t
MPSIHRRFIAFILLISHSLMSCYNLNIHPQVQEAPVGSATPMLDDFALQETSTTPPIQPSPIFLIKGGHQVHFIDPTATSSTAVISREHNNSSTSANKIAPSPTLYPQSAQIIDVFGIQNQVPVKFEHQIPLPYNTLMEKGSSLEWCKYNMHLLTIGGQKCLYIGKTGLMGGVNITEDDCTYQANVSEGKAFTQFFDDPPISRIHFEPKNGYWSGNVLHTAHFSFGGDLEWHRGWVYSNYSDLNEEELSASKKVFIFECPWYKFGYIKEVKYILAYLSPKKRERLRAEREKKRKNEAENIERNEKERKAQEAAQQAKEVAYRKDQAILLAHKTMLEQKCTQLGTQNTQIATIFERVAYYRNKNLITARKLQASQQDNLHTAKKLFQDNSELTQKLQQTQQVVQSLSQAVSQDQHRKEALKQRIAERKGQLQQAQKMLACLQAGPIEANDLQAPSTSSTEELDDDILKTFTGPLLKRIQSLSRLDKFSVLQEDKEKKEQIQAEIQAIENAINKEQTALEEEQQQVTQLKKELVLQLFQEATRKIDLNQLLTQQRNQLAQAQGGLQDLIETHGNTQHLAENVRQTWVHNEQLAEELVNKKQQSKDTIEKIIPDRSDAPAILQQQLKEAQQRLIAITQQKQQAHQQQIKVVQSIQERSKRIQQLQEQIASLSKQYQPTSQTRPLEEVGHQQQALEQQLQQLINQVAKEKTQLQQAQQVAKHLQETLQQEIAQEKVKQQQLKGIEQALNEHIEEGKALAQEIQQAFHQELARNIESDKETAALIQQLRKEAQSFPTPY